MTHTVESIVRILVDDMTDSLINGTPLKFPIPSGDMLLTAMTPFGKTAFEVTEAEWQMWLEAYNEITRRFAPKQTAH